MNGLYKKLTKKVEFCLLHDPHTRNSDVSLMISVWRNFYPERIQFIDGKLRVALSDIYDLPREDHIKRIRAKIQNEENRFLPSDPEVAIKRRIKADLWREGMSKTATV